MRYGNKKKITREQVDTSNQGQLRRKTQFRSGYGLSAQEISKQETLAT